MQVISFNLGKFGIILSRKNLLYIIVVVACILVIYMLLQAGFLAHDHHLNSTSRSDLMLCSGPISNIQWKEFVDDCGLDKFRSNRQKTMRVFDSKYIGKVYAKNCLLTSN